MSPLFRRLLYWFKAQRFRTDLEDELQFHQEMTRESLQARGRGPLEADRASRLALGNTTLALEDARTVWTTWFFDDLIRDTRHALRLVRRQPGFSALTIATLAVGIGAVTAVVSILQVEMWQPLPYPAPQELVSVTATTAQEPNRFDGVTASEFVAIESQARGLASVGGFRWNVGRVVTGEPGAERVSVSSISTNLFEVLRVPMALGRGFRPEEGLPGAAAVAVVSHEFWQRYFGGRSDVLQRTIAVDDRPHAIVGVAPADFHPQFTSDPHLFVPITDVTPGARDINVIARKRPSGPADSEIEREIGRILEPTFDSAARQRGRHFRVRDLHEHTAAGTWRTYIVFLVAAVVLLLAACANVANLLLGRSLTRRPEFVLRAALGGSRGRLLRQLLVESALVAGAAALGGIALAAFGIRAFVALAPPSYITVGRSIDISLTVAVAAIGLSAITSALCGVLPARHAPRGDLREALATAGRRIGGDPDQRRLRTGLLAVEVTLAFLLLVSAGILTNSFLRLNAVPLGFSPDGICTFRVLLRGDRYADRPQLAVAHADLAARVAAVPGVTGVALANSVPLAGSDSLPFVVAGDPVPAGPSRGTLHVVTPEYFSLLGIRGTAGRYLTADDRPGRPRVALVNVNLARRFFGGRDPIGHRLTLLKSASGVPEGDVEIVGVVDNVKEVGIDEVAFESIYLPLAQNPLPTITVLAATAGGGVTSVEAFRQAVRSSDPNVPVYGAMTLEQRVSDAYRTDRFNFLLVSGVAMLAVFLAAIGVYGVTAYDSSRRTAEFGLRMALGATPASILRLAAARSVGIAAVGIVGGLVIAAIAARMIGDAVYLVEGKHVGVVYEVALTDPLTLAIVCVLFLGLAAGAAWTPARRATLVDPIAALRE